MLTVIFKTFVTFFVIYGMIAMFSRIIDSFKNFESGEVFVFIHVKNKEDSLEYIVRSTIMNYLSNYGGRIVPYIVVVDKGSQDRTEEISRHLAREFEFLYYVTEDEYRSFKNNIESR